MHSGEMFTQLLGPLYEAACNPDGWPVFLEQLAGAFQAPWCALHVEDLERHRCDAHVEIGFDPAFTRSYEEYYASKNVFFLTGASHFRTGGVVVNKEVCPDSVYHRSEFYCDWAARQGHGEALHGTIAAGAGSNAGIDIIRARRARTFDESDRALLTALIPHLQRAVQLQQKFDELAALDAVTGEALDRWSMGVILLSSSARVIRANHAARELFEARTGLVVDRAVLKTLRSDETRRLHELIANAARSRHDLGTRPGGAMAITRPGDDRPLRVLVTPASNGGLLRSNRASCMMFVEHAELAHETDRELLRRLYGLTAAEAQVAALMVTGLTTKEIAAQLGVSRDTTKKQAGSIFSKTGTKRHAELVAAILSAPTSKKFK